MKADEYDSIQGKTNQVTAFHHLANCSYCAPDHVISSSVELWFKSVRTARLKNCNRVKKFYFFKKKVHVCTADKNKLLRSQCGNWCCMIQAADSLVQLLSGWMGQSECWPIQLQEELKVVAVIKSLVFPSVSHFSHYVTSTNAWVCTLTMSQRLKHKELCTTFHQKGDAWGTMKNDPNSKNLLLQQLLV